VAQYYKKVSSLRECAKKVRAYSNGDHAACEMCSVSTVGTAEAAHSEKL